MGEPVTLEDARSYSALGRIEAMLNEMEHSSDNLEGKNEYCPLQRNNTFRSRDLAAVSYYLRAKASIDDFDQLKLVRRGLRIYEGYEFLEKHVVGCKRCLRTLKIALEQKPKLEQERLEKLTSALLMTNQSAVDSILQSEIKFD